MAEPIGVPEARLTFDEAYESMRGEIHRALSSTPIIVRRYTKHLLGAQGKHIRAISLLCCAMDRQNRIDPNAVQFAAATEILHLATLVHDDVIDNADLRRGIPSLQKQYGKRTAVICGDYLFSVALNLAGRARRRREYESFQLPDYISQIALGELLEHIHNGDLALSEMEYYRIVSGKTAALFEASFYGGALLSGCEEAEAKRYKRLGWHAGMVFQIIDDCNDFESTRQKAKKTVQSDYEQNVITLPLLAALKSAEDSGESIRAGKATRAELDRFVSDWGGLAYAHEVARRFGQRAFGILSTLDLTEEKRKKLSEILHKAMRS